MRCVNEACFYGNEARGFHKSTEEGLVTSRDMLPDLSNMSKGSSSSATMARDENRAPVKHAAEQRYPPENAGWHSGISG